jgi:predicted DNA-binding transcriptional regulator AlpA
MERLLNQKETAERLGMSEAWLERDRWAGAKIPFIKLGRAVRYDPRVIEEVLRSRTRSSTSEAQGQCPKEG